MSDFVSIPFTTSEQDLEDAAIAYLQSKWPDWDPEPADQEVIQIEALAPMAVNGLRLASRMPAEALIAFGVKLFGIPFQGGQSAYTTVRFTLQDTAGYTVDALAEIEIDGYAFALVGDVTAAPGSSTVDALVASVEPTAAANDLTGATVASLTLPVWVTGIEVLAPTANGADPETADQYLDRVARDRRFTSRAIVTLLDVELAALDVPGVGRAHADALTGRAVHVTATDLDGAALSSPMKTALAAAFPVTRRMANATFTIEDPTYTTVNVTYSVEAEPGFDHADLVARCNAALKVELSPLTHGLPEAGDASDTTWIVDAKIYGWRLVGVLAAVPGTRRVVALSINSGANGADLSLSGDVPLPLPGTISGSVI